MNAQDMKRMMALFEAAPHDLPSDQEDPAVLAAARALAQIYVAKQRENFNSLAAANADDVDNDWSMPGAANDTIGDWFENDINESGWLVEAIRQAVYQEIANTGSQN